MSLFYVQYTINTTTYSTDKTRERPGYTQIVDREEHFRTSVDWRLEHHLEKYKIPSMS